MLRQILGKIVSQKQCNLMRDVLGIYVGNFLGFLRHSCTANLGKCLRKT